MRIGVIEGARILRAGGIVAFPTETVYGLGADALDPRAVRKIFTAKGRPSDNPLIVHVSDEGMVHQVAARVPPGALRLARAFWPGPLTIVLPKRADVPSQVTAGLATVGVRMPSHPKALALIRRARVPIAAPSANRSGRPSPTTAGHVAQDFPGIPLIDGGPCTHGVESTVVDLSGPVPRVLRQGAITLESLRKILPTMAVARHNPVRPASPGMKHRHYAPDIPLRICRTRQEVESYLGSHPRAVELVLSRDPAVAARRLYHALRHPPRDAKELVVALFPEQGIGRTLNDRLRRAATRT